VNVSDSPAGLTTTGFTSAMDGKRFRAPDGVVNADDPACHLIHSDRWQHVETWREVDGVFDGRPKEVFHSHAAGGAGSGSPRMLTLWSCAMTMMIAGVRRPMRGSIARSPSGTTRPTTWWRPSESTGCPRAQRPTPMTQQEHRVECVLDRMVAQQSSRR